MAIDVNQFRGMFFEEARDYVATFERGVLCLEADPTDMAALQDMFRAAHSLKGCGATLGVKDVAAFTHILEDLLDPMRDGELTATPELIELLLAASDMLADLLVRAREERGAPEAMDALVAKLEAPVRALRGATGLPDVAPQGKPAEMGPLRYDVQIRCAQNLLLDGLDPLPLLRELDEVTDVERITADVSRVPALANLEAEACYLDWSLRVYADGGPATIHEIFEFVEDLCQVTVIPAEDTLEAPGSPVARRATGLDSSPADAATLRVATARIDEMIDLVGELVIAQASLAQTAVAPAGEDAMAESIDRMGRSLRELQHCALSVRTIPMSTVFMRFPRLVRDLGAELDKQVQLRVVGGETELDKSVLEGLSGPLTHFIRNAVDHGLESADTRTATGKPACGSLTISARQEHGSVLIEIRDDGRGLDRDRILARARAMGLLGPEESLTEDRLFGMIFEPGFSTAHAVSDVSGRGVGMDAARSAIEALSGTVHVKSEHGKGTLVRITLPLTLAILDGFALRVAEQTYVVPLLSVLEVVQPSRGDFSAVLGRGELVSVRGEVLRIVRLREVLGHPPAIDDTAGFLAVVEVLEERYALLVDELMGQVNVVIKALDESVKTSPAILGGAIQGDGSIALILDLVGVVRVHQAGAARATAALASAEGRRSA